MSTSAPKPGLPELLEHALDLRAVFTDMDGTLLSPESALPAEAPRAIRRLQATGVRFVPTTGRVLWSVRRVFGELTDEIDVVAGNGMDVIAAGSSVRHEEYDRASVLRLLDAVRASRRHVTMVAFDEVDGSYLYEGDVDFARARSRSLREGGVRTGSDELPDPVTKLAVVSVENATETSAELSAGLEDVFTFAPCGEHWTDVLIRGVDKATGIADVLRARDAGPAQAVGFGDSMNDCGMMRLLPLSVAVENAMPGLDALCAYRIGPNRDASVVDACLRIAEARERAGLSA